MKRSIRRTLALLLALLIALPGFAVCADDGAPEEQPAIYPLQVIRTPAELEAVDGAQPYEEVWMNGQISADLFGHLGLAYSLNFSSRIQFRGSLPAGYDPEKLIEWGKYPGLNVDILHAHGFTGKGAVVAYVDQPLPAHEQYDRETLHYQNNAEQNHSMHGPAVMSLLTGKDIGTAPEAEVYFYGHSTWKADQVTHVECLHQIIEQNKSLPEARKIRMVGFSDNIDDTEQNADAFRAAVKECEDAGIMVWFCGEYGAFTFTPTADKNSFRSVSPAHWWKDSVPQLVLVPESGRTTASQDGYSQYTYWSEGGLSWTMPYMLGLYAIAIEIDPALTQDELRTLVTTTAHISDNDLPIVDPVAFVSAVLRRVGRDQEAQAMEDEVKARTKYLYAVMDTAAMSEEDLTAVGSYLAAVTDATVLVADAGRFADVSELYTALRDDAQARGGTVAGVQIFGTADMVPAFDIRYKVQMNGEEDDMGTLLTDLFYGSFENDPAVLTSGYSVMDHFAQGLDVDLTPRWPVARLPLMKGEFAPFFEKYKAFALDTGLARLDLVNFSNPIFDMKDSVDSMGRFLLRADTEFKLMDAPYRLYGNLRGQYPVTYPVLGGFEPENLTAENQKGPAEFLINSHGQRDNIDKAFFVDGEEQRESLVNSDSINAVLGENPYYLDVWTCHNGDGMEDNLTTAALNGQCVGMFSATHILSNNGIFWDVSLSDMAKSNPFYFFYHYLKALHEGQTRSRAFFTAQRAYAQALLAHSRTAANTDGYQFNLYNLLAYHNFGVLEPNAACLALYDCQGIISRSQQIRSALIRRNMTAGQPQGEAWAVNYDVSDGLLVSGPMTVHGVTAQPLDNGYTRFTLSYTLPHRMNVFVFDPPNAETIQISAQSKGSDQPEELVFDLEDSVWKSLGFVNVSFYQSDDDRCFVGLHLGSGSGGSSAPAVQAPGGSFTTEGQAKGSAKRVIYQVDARQLASGAMKVHQVTAQPLDNGYTRFTLSYTLPRRMNIFIFDPPNGEKVSISTGSAGSSEPEELVFDLEDSVWKTIQNLSVSFYLSDDDRCFVFLTLYSAR